MDSKFRIILRNNIIAFESRWLIKSEFTIKIMDPFWIRKIDNGSTASFRKDSEFILNAPKR